ncbi:MAG: TIGR02281 family clan AA aspartic protease [Chitinivibrionia bacterium]|nr:TIGR02281 family clan AA aspartic protease [Chitinivibrionia bacterium]
MIFLAIGLLVVSVVLYALTGEGDTIAGLPREDFPRLAAPLSILIFLMAGVTRLSVGRAAEALKALGSWMAIGLVLVALYAYRAEIGEVSDRVVQELQPGTVQTVSQGAGGRGAVVKIRRTSGGHFIARTKVNGRSVRMIVDTGASTVVLRPEDARRARIELGALSYTVPVDTANGRAFAARIKLDKVTVGALTIENVDALVTRPGALQQSLLGMSFLSRLRSYEFSGNQLLMRS